MFLCVDDTEGKTDSLTLSGFEFVIWLINANQLEYMDVKILHDGNLIQNM